MLTDMNLTIAYGMTETSGSFQTSASDPLERRLDRRTGSPHVECEIIDEQGATVARVSKASYAPAVIRSPKGYWDEPVYRPKRSTPMTGCIPAISPSSTPRATATSPSGSRT